MKKPRVLLVLVSCAWFLLADHANGQCLGSVGCTSQTTCGYCDSLCPGYNDCCYDYLPLCEEIPIISWRQTFMIIQGPSTESTLQLEIDIMEADGTALDRDTGFTSLFPFTISIIEATASSPEDVILQTPTLTYTLDGVTTVVTAVVTINPNTIGESDEYFSLQITSGYGSVTPIDTMTIQIEATPPNGQILVVDPPQVQRKKFSGNINLYALAQSPDIKHVLRKNIPTEVPQFIGAPLPFAVNQGYSGVNITVPATKHFRTLKFGYYESGFTRADKLNVIGAPVTIQNDCLRVSERKTITVYPKEEGSPLLSEDLTLRIPADCFTCIKMTWKRNGAGLRRNNGRHTLVLSTVQQANGVFQVARRRGAALGQYAMFEVIVADCPKGTFKDGSGSCSGICPECMNNGVCNSVGLCDCPPCFIGHTCERAGSMNGFRVWSSTIFECSKLNDGDSCKGLLFCYGNYYGCSCGCGWHGPNCAQKCRKGSFGVECKQHCNCIDHECDFQTGTCPNGCKPGYTGFNCQTRI